MTRFLDARIPVAFSTSPAEAVEGDAILREGEDFDAAGAHPAACACCTGRTSAARALSSLFLARARGTRVFFARVLVVLVTEDGREAVEAALRGDVLVSQWFKEG